MKLGLIVLCLIAACSISAGAAPTLLPRVLHPAYWDWVRGPGEMYGFWLWTGSATLLDQVNRTGANSTSMHLTFWPAQDKSSAKGIAPVPADAQLGFLPEAGDAMKRLSTSAGVGVGEHNNAWFVRYPKWFWDTYPNAAMRDKSGKVIRAGDSPVPALDDPTLTELSKRQMSGIVERIGKEPWVRYWVIAGEESYPDYFGLAEGDYRPASRRHYTACQQMHKTTSSEDSWKAFRDSAMVDRFAGYTSFMHGLDQSRPVLTPTHGNPFALDLRSKLTFPISELAGAADGFEAGPIAIDDDEERLIRMTLDMQSSFGVPVAAPRIADKTLNPARGGGKSFTPASLRRFIYEALGLGVWHIGLVQWQGSLPDGEWAIAGTPAEAECKKVFEELRRLSPWLDNCSRLQPQVALCVSTDTWKKRWQDRWTLAYDQMIKRGWHVTIVTDDCVGPELAKRIPVLISVDNTGLSDGARKRLAAYVSAKGRVIEVPDAAGAAVTVSHRTQTTTGANVWTSRVRPVTFDGIESIAALAADLRPVEVTESGKQAEAIEVLPLTDGTNIIAVVINRSDRERSVEAALSPRLALGTHRHTVQDLLRGDGVKLDGCRIPISIAEFGTAVIPFEAKSDPSPAVAYAEQAVGRWKKVGADTSLLASLLHRAQEHLKAGRPAKALALARTITSALALKASVSFDGSGLMIDALAWVVDGKPAADVRLRVRLVPGPLGWRQLKETSPGRYSLLIPKSNLPKVYDPLSERYDIPRGAISVIFDSWQPGHWVSCRRTVNLR